MAEARRAGAVDRGWLPDILPDTSTNVREVHNIDSSETWCAFELTEAESARLRAKMSVLGPAEAARRTIRSPGVAWWPRALQGTLDQRALDRAGITLYGSGRFLFAFEGSSGPSYMYRDSVR